MLHVLRILVNISTLLNYGIATVSASSSYFEMVYGKESGKESLKKEFFQCDRNSFCTNVVKMKNGQFETANGEEELKKLREIACIWKKIKHIEETTQIKASKSPTKACKTVQALGMQSRTIPDSSITASTTYLNFSPANGRLNGNGWVADYGDSQPFFQVDFGRKVWLHAVATQGHVRYGSTQSWVKLYQVSYSDDGSTFQVVCERFIVPKQFSGNTSPNDIAKRDLPVPVETRYVRILPQTWNHNPALRAEFYGCLI